MSKTALKQQVYTLPTRTERAAILRSTRGAWKNRKPDPLIELKKIRKEWERNIT